MRAPRVGAAMATSTFTGGAKLKAKIRELAKQIEGKHNLRVGFLEGSTYPNGDGEVVTAAQTAFWLNYGHQGTPPRPFFTDLIRDKSDSWGDALGRLLVQNDFDVDLSLQQMGEGIAGQVRTAIINLNSPALSPVTIMLRKMLKEDPSLEVTGATVGEAAARVAAGEDVSGVSTKVGVATGHMLNSVSYEVENDN